MQPPTSHRSPPQTAAATSVLPPTDPHSNSASITSKLPHQRRAAHRRQHALTHATPTPNPNTLTPPPLPPNSSRPPSTNETRLTLAACPCSCPTTVEAFRPSSPGQPHARQPLPLPSGSAPPRLAATSDPLPPRLPTSSRQHSATQRHPENLHAAPPLPRSTPLCNSSPTNAARIIQTSTPGLDFPHKLSARSARNPKATTTTLRMDIMGDEDG